VGRHKDTHPPSVVLGFPPGQNVSSIVSSGLRSSMSCSEPCTAKLRLLLDTTVLGTRKARLPAGKKEQVVIPLTSGGKAKLSHEKGSAKLSLKARVSDASGNTRKLERHLTVRG
jgi:hypothetical protein